MKTPVLLFIAAVMYHTAQWLKALKQPMPAEILFSGRGSVILKALPQNALGDFALKMFSKVMDEGQASSTQAPAPSDDDDPLAAPVATSLSKPSKIKIHISEAPKELTCKGGLFVEMKEGQSLSSKTLLGIRKPFITEEAGYRYEKLEANAGNVPKLVYEEELMFFNTLFGIDREFNFVSNFAVDGTTLKLAKELATEEDSFEGWITRGVEQAVKSYSNNLGAVVNETMFFYGITGYLNALAFWCHRSGKAQ
jgi:hypothetical protein